MLDSMTRRNTLIALAALPLTAKAELPASATLVVPYPPGSAPDMLARVVATKMGEETGKTFVVENRPGANAIIGSTYVAKGRANGSVLLLVDRMTLVANPLLYKSLPYDPKTLAGVSDLAQVNLFLTVQSGAPYKTWSEFVAYAKANPGKLSIGSGGPGSVHHLSLELMSKAIGAQFTHVPYKGIVPAVQDLLGGQISAVISGAEVVQPHMASGKLRVLATGAEQRSPLFPDAPTLIELGMQTPVLLPTTFTLFAPSGMPTADIAALNTIVRKAMTDPHTAKRLHTTGMLPVVSAPQDIRKSLDKLASQIATVIRDANIQLD